MLLSEIKWSPQNKDSERSQIIYRGEQVYLLTRTEPDMSQNSPLEIKCMRQQGLRYLYRLLHEGNDLIWSGHDPAGQLANMSPRKMTPLEYKCWQLEQKR